jgi:hypothetical protein
VKPCAFFACSAARVRAEISSRSCWASTAKIPMVNVFASGRSTATKSTLLSRRWKMNWTLRDNRSSFAMTRVAFDALAVRVVVDLDTRKNYIAGA